MNPARAGSLSFGILSTYPPTRCGLASYSAALCDGLHANGAEVSVVRVADGLPTEHPRVVGELTPGSAAAAADLLSHSDVAVIQYDFGIYGGDVGDDDVVDVIGGVRVPSILVAHSVPKNPTRHQRWVLEALARRADHVVVMSDVAKRQLRVFDVDERKVTTIPHGATVPSGTLMKRGGRPTLLTWGLLRPGKGVERVIDAMVSLRELSGQPRYLIAGPTHPRVLAADGEAYRDTSVERAQRIGLGGTVQFDDRYRSMQSLTELMLSAVAVVLPYDSTDQVSSGVLINTLACGRPVVATAFPHAVELLASGAGIVVKHDDPDELQFTLKAVLTQPRLSGSMAAEARRLAPTMSWSIAARSYQAVAQRIIAGRREKAWPR